MSAKRNDWVEAIGKPAYEAIAEMVAALKCDYDCLEALRDEREALMGNRDLAAEEEGKEDEFQAAVAAIDQWDKAHHDELRDLEAAAGDCTSEEDARQRIKEDPLVEVRSGWTAPDNSMKAEKFCLLLSTGGPATRIVGDLDRDSPSEPRLEVQDGFKPWTEYCPAEEDVLQAYCECFYFGE